MAKRRLSGMFASFKPQKAPQEPALGELESQIMDVLWQQGEATVRQVQRALHGQRQLAYSTVMTVMSRLAEKSLLQRTKVGKTFVYRPALTHEEFCQHVSQEVVRALLDSYGRSAIASFVEVVSEGTPEGLEDLERLLKRQRAARQESQ